MLLKQSRGARKPIIGMVQLGPLAGSSRHRDDSIGKVLDAALEDAALLARHGIDAVMLQNLGDLPVALRVAAPQIAWMTRMASEVARETRLPVGLNSWRTTPRRCSRWLWPLRWTSCASRYSWARW